DDRWMADLLEPPLGVDAGTAAVADVLAQALDLLAQIVADVVRVGERLERARIEDLFGGQRLGLRGGRRLARARGLLGLLGRRLRCLGLPLVRRLRRIRSVRGFASLRADLGRASAPGARGQLLR